MRWRNRVLVGDAAEQLARLPSACLETVITSPPYLLLRDYGMPGQYGLEPDVTAYVARLRAVFVEVARVLVPTGSLWLNLGDSFSRHARYGAPPKSLLLAPERLLLALSADGWLVRNKIVWAKSNPRPSSVGDRLSCTWEPLFMLVRSHAYYFDLDAIRVPHTTSLTCSPKARRRRKLRATDRSAVRRIDRADEPATTAAHRAPDWAGPLAGDNAGLARLKARGLVGHPGGKNPGDVWQLASSGYRGAHFATFPEALVERPLLATCPAQVCRSCRRPWQRRDDQVELTAACDCRAGGRPGRVLDPFMGAGTVAVVAEQLGRDWCGVELNPAFADLTARRLANARAGPERAAA